MVRETKFKNVLRYTWQNARVVLSKIQPSRVPDVFCTKIVILQWPHATTSSKVTGRKTNEENLGLGDLSKLQKREIE